MKIIKSFLLITVCLTATNLLHAQEVKASATGNKETSAAPQLKPMNGVTPTATPVAVADIPSPFKKNDDKKQMQEPKLQLVSSEAATATNKLTAEQLKTMNGTAQKPKELAPVLVDNAQNNNPGSKPAIVKIVQNK